ncbi:MAG: hybrid sensor histidine kinase/response regulator, partial [Bacteroidetes bacterium]|nr:hybrid sensor histidine kinase/response regulator [Bacteroidota bacterium]
QANLFNNITLNSTPGTQNEKGTGIGLILCKEFVEKHHGKIWMESQEGSGSKFCFSFPGS